MSDHKKEALYAISAAEIGGYDERDIHMLLAQTHATLYLAEQQRIANLIASIDKWGGESNSWPYAIKEGLGLA